MADGSRSPEKEPLISRRGFLRGLMATMAEARLGILTAGIVEAQDPPENKRESIYEGLTNFKVLLEKEINISRNLELLQNINQFKSQEEMEIKKKFHFFDGRRSDVVSLGDDLQEEIEKDYKFRFDGEFGKDGFTDIKAFEKYDTNGKLLIRELEFYADLEGKVISAPVLGVRKPNNFNEQELLVLVSKVLKNPPQSNQWTLGDDSEGDFATGLIGWKKEEDGYQKIIYVNQVGRVKILVNLSQ